MSQRTDMAQRVVVPNAADMAQLGMVNRQIDEQKAWNQQQLHEQRKVFRAQVRVQLAELVIKNTDVSWVTRMDYLKELVNFCEALLPPVDEPLE